MRQWTTSGRVKIERAKEHIGNLEALIAAFRQRNPSSSVRRVEPNKEDPNTWDVVHYAIVRETPPLRWGAIAGDAIHNLRCSLDHLWVFAMKPGGGYFGEQFPIYDSAADFEAHHRRAIKGPRKAAVDLLKEIKPYRGGNDLLWLLRELDNIDKHQVLIPAFAMVERMVEDFSAEMTAMARVFHPNIQAFPPTVDIHFEFPPVCPVEDGTELLRIHHVSGGLPMEVHVQPLFPLEIAFGEIEVVRCRPLLPLLKGLLQEVERTSEKFVDARLVR